MKLSRLLRSTQTPWANGLRLAVLNAGLAAFSIVSFLGVLAIVSWINQLRLASGNNSSALPFPYLLLMLLYAILFLLAWGSFGRGLSGSWREKIITVLLGCAPLFVLSALGYAGVFGAVLFNEMNPDVVPAGSVFVFGGISTVILVAGTACAGVILLASGTHPSSSGSTSTLSS